MRLYLIFVLCFVNIYIFFNIVFSKDGIVGISSLRTQKQELSKMLNYKILPENREMRKKIAFLSQETLNTQYLEVVLKKELSYSDKNEVLLLTKDEI